MDANKAAYYSDTQDRLFSWQLPREVPADFARPYFVLTFKRDNNDLTPLGIYDLIVELHQYSDVELQPISYGGDKERSQSGVFSMALACASIVDAYGNDLRNALRLPGYEARLFAHGVTDVQFSNFPEPFLPQARFGIRYHLQGEPKCP